MKRKKSPQKTEALRKLLRRVTPEQGARDLDALLKNGEVKEEDLRASFKRFWAQLTAAPSVGACLNAFLAHEEITPEYLATCWRVESQAVWRLRGDATPVDEITLSAVAERLAKELGVNYAALIVPLSAGLARVRQRDEEAVSNAQTPTFGVASRRFDGRGPDYPIR